MNSAARACPQTASVTPISEAAPTMLRSETLRMIFSPSCKPAVEFGGEFCGSVYRLRPRLQAE